MDCLLQCSLPCVGSMMHPKYVGLLQAITLIPLLAELDAQIQLHCFNLTGQHTLASAQIQTPRFVKHLLGQNFFAMEGCLHLKCAVADLDWLQNQLFCQLRLAHNPKCPQWLGIWALALFWNAGVYSVQCVVFVQQNHSWLQNKNQQDVHIISPSHTSMDGGRNCSLVTVTSFAGFNSSQNYVKLDQLPNLKGWK